MEDQQYEKLKQTVDRVNKEFMIGNQQFLLFNNFQELEDAIIANKVPGVKWTENDELLYQRDLLEEQYNDSFSKEELAELELAATDPNYPLL